MTHIDVTHIAHLARLALTEQELAHYQEQLSAILDYAARLNELDLSSVALAPVRRPPQRLARRHRNPLPAPRRRPLQRRRYG